MSQIQITPDLLADLKRKAEACEPKVYELNEDSKDSYFYIDAHLNKDEVKIVSSVAFLSDAEHIATADPATVLALVAEIERLQLEILRLEDSLDAISEFPESEAAGE